MEGHSFCIFSERKYHFSDLMTIADGHEFPVGPCIVVIRDRFFVDRHKAPNHWLSDIDWTIAILRHDSSVSTSYSFNKNQISLRFYLRHSSYREKRAIFVCCPCWRTNSAFWVACYCSFVEYTIFSAGILTWTLIFKDFHTAELRPFLINICPRRKTTAPQYNLIVR